MRKVLCIFLLVLTAFFGSSCQDVPTRHDGLVRREAFVQLATESDCLLRAWDDFRFREGTLTNAPVVGRTICPSEEKAETQSGERTSSSFSRGGKASTAYRSPHSTIHLILGGFTQRTTVSIRSFASHIRIFYVLRHIIR